MRAPASGELLIDHVSAQGPQVTHIRGILLMNAFDNLREWGLYERYLEQLPPDARYMVQSVIASSWVELAVATTHYEASAQLGIEQGRAVEAGERLRVLERDWPRPSERPDPARVVTHFSWR